MENRYLKTCPLCGAKLNGQEKDNELLGEINTLKEKGILQQTMFVAVKIVESMNDKNPAWLKSVLDKQSDKINDSIQKNLTKEIRPVLEAIMELKGSPQTIGRIQEEAIAKRLSSLKTGQDRFKMEKSRRSQEDVECLVIENGSEIGKIVIESKHTKKWQEAYVEQTKRYMEKECTEFGILATKTLPEDMLSNTIWRDGVLVVKLEHIEPAYIFMRELLKLKRALEGEYSTRVKQLEVRDQILEELKNTITSGELDSIIERIDTATLNIDNTISKTENYLSRIFKNIRKDTGNIRDLTSKLISDHIEKIRTQIIQQPPSSFL